MASDQISMFGEVPPTPAAKEKPASFTITKTFQANTQKVFDQWLIPVFRIKNPNSFSVQLD